jgi:hypothetical protein
VRRWANFVSTARHHPSSTNLAGPGDIDNHAAIIYIAVHYCDTLSTDYPQKRVRDYCTHPALPGPRALRFFATILLPPPDSPSKVRIAACIVSTGHSLRVYPVVPVMCTSLAVGSLLSRSLGRSFPAVADTMRASPPAPRLLMDMCSRISPD